MFIVTFAPAPVPTTLDVIKFELVKFPFKKSVSVSSINWLTLPFVLTLAKEARLWASAIKSEKLKR